MPNSILWIGLVVLWLFVLFPMLADRHPRIRQTTDTALATRVLHRGGSKRKVKGGPAAGHDSDPDWRPRQRHAEDWMDQESSDNLPALQVPVDDDYVPDRRGRGGFDPEADALARSARYAFRQRVVLCLVLVGLAAGAFGLAAFPRAWWFSAAAFVGVGLYLGYLRRQVRLEEEIRRRRMARTGHRSHDDAPPAAPRRSQSRPTGVVLEADDEDPEFDHLTGYDHHSDVDYDDPDLRRASGE